MPTNHRTIKTYSAFVQPRSLAIQAFEFELPEQLTVFLLVGFLILVKRRRGLETPVNDESIVENGKFVARDMELAYL
ncbi:hypothetical protein TNCV_959851 [Trichonephila clavipes]|nr:hypothetical protein TNCV_959851 [Trichonephila clavipes]